MNIHEHKYKIAVLGLILGVLILNISSFTKNSLNNVHAEVNDTVFLEIDSDDPTMFKYNGQQVKLKGVNINNVGALGIYQASNINNIEAGPGDYQKIAELGANHVRFGISYQWYLNDPVNFYNILDQHVEWARENKLWMVITNFILPYLGENTDDGAAFVGGGCYQGYGNPCNFWGAGSEAAQAREDYKEFIYELVSRYKTNATVAGYDFINEPWSQDETYSPVTNSLIYFGELIDGIVSGNHNDTQLFFIESEPEPLSWVVYQSYAGGIADLNEMKTTSENRLVLSVHIYEPFTLTHYDRVTYPTTEDGVVWDQDSMSNPTSPDVYPGEIVERLRTGVTVDVNGETYSTLADYLTDYPHDFRNRYGLLFTQSVVEVPIYVGEWSAQQTEQIDGSGWFTDTFIDYNIDMANLFDEWGVHDAVFEFKAGMENWGLFTETGPQPEDGFNEQVSYNADNPSETVQPFIDELENIWGSIVKPVFDDELEIVQCQNGKLEAGEMCDDGNNVNGDGCSTLCKIEKKGPVVSSIRNTCDITASYADFRMDAFHEIASVSYNPNSIPADSGYTYANQQIKLGNNGTNYNIPYLWFQNVEIDENVDNAYIDFNNATAMNPSALTATIYGLKVGNNLANYNPDGSTPDRFYVDRNPYQTYLGGDNWINWQSWNIGNPSSPFVGFPHNVLTRSGGAVYQWTRTTANSSWVLPTGSQIMNNYQATSDIGPVINELIGQSGWTSGNDLGVILIPQTGDSNSIRTFYGYDATINTSLADFSFTPTNNDSSRFAKLYANCSPYISGLTANNDAFSLDFNTDVEGDVSDNNGSGSDLNPGSYSIVYRVMEDVQHGDLDFNTTDGTFTYTPTIGYSGGDSFRYVVSDLNGGTDDAVVNFTVIGNSLPTVTASILSSGNLTTPFSLVSVASDSDGTITGYSWSRISGPAAVTFSSANSANTTASFTQYGQYVIQVAVTDDDGGSATDTVTINIPAPVTSTPPANNGSGNNSGNGGDLPVSIPLPPRVDENSEEDNPINNNTKPQPDFPIETSNETSQSSLPLILTVLVGIALVGGGIFGAIKFRNRNKDNYSS